MGQEIKDLVRDRVMNKTALGDLKFKGDQRWTVSI